MGVLLKIHFIILATLFITKPTSAKPACAVCIPPVASTNILGISENIFYILLFLILFLIFCITLYLFKHKNIKQNSSSLVMEKKDELEKLFLLKEKGIITEEEFNLKREEFLNDTTDVSETGSSGFSLWGIIVVLSGLLTFCSIISGGNSDKICGLFSGDRHRPSTLAFLFTPNGDIEIEFPNPNTGWEWSKYDQQRICISGNIRKKNYVVGDQASYIVYNPRFNGYAN